MIEVVYLLVVILAVAVLLGILMVTKRLRTGRSNGPRIYGGPIRFTDPSGRNMKIIQKDDGSFETVEE